VGMRKDIQERPPIGQVLREPARDAHPVTNGSKESIRRTRFVEHQATRRAREF
jgi:hypothetical protein